MGGGAAHHSRVAFHHVKAQAATVKYLRVSFDVLLVVVFQPFLVDVEAVGVLHQELPGP
jgi:hypothetical protein